MDIKNQSLFGNVARKLLHSVSQLYSLNQEISEANLGLERKNQRL